MKNTLVVILIFFLALSASACSQNNQSPTHPVTFYYTGNTIQFNSASAVITKEVREEAHCGDSLHEILNIYLQGPVGDTCINPFPAGSQILELEEDADVLFLTLNSPFAELRGSDLTIACACLSKTVMELSDCRFVEISVSGALLDGSQSIRMDAQSLLLVDSQLGEGV